MEESKNKPEEDNRLRMANPNQSSLKTSSLKPSLKVPFPSSELNSGQVIMEQQLFQRLNRQKYRRRKRNSMRRECCLWIFKSFFFILVMALPYVAKSFFITEEKPNGIVDIFLDWTAKANDGLKRQGSLTLQVIISLLSDIFYVFNWGYWVLFIHNSRMPLAWTGVLIIFTLAQLCWDVKAPENIKWEELNFPSLLLPFRRTSAVFFSLDIAFFNLANLEWHRRGIKWLWMTGTFLGAVVGFVLIILRRNYSIGVIFGAITAHYCFILARKMDKYIDKKVERLCSCRRQKRNEGNHSEETFQEERQQRREEAIDEKRKEDQMESILFE